jgi:hypothetical protein
MAALCDIFVHDAFGTAHRAEASTYGIARYAPVACAGPLLAAEIEDRPDNTTRFFVVGRRLFGASGRDRTTLLVSTGTTEAPGALYRLLEPLDLARRPVLRAQQVELAAEAVLPELAVAEGTEAAVRLAEADAPAKTTTEPDAQTRAEGPLLAYRMNGKPMSIREKGRSGWSSPMMT